MFILNENRDLKYLTVEEFSKTNRVRHCFSTRAGGVSENEYSSMNLRFNCSDSYENVLKNFEILSSEISVNYEHLVLTKQVHEDIIKCVDKSHWGNGIGFENQFDSADGLICGERNVPLTVFGADCLPVMFLDPENGVIATAHSGWKGTLLKISQKTAEKMINKYNSKPENIIVAIGPSIRVCHYEVSEELGERFFEAFGGECVKMVDKKPHIDMQYAVKQQLADLGVRNVIDSGICTYCNSDLYFSHRKTNGKRGVMVGIIELI